MTMVVRAPDTEEELSLRVYVMKRSNYSLKNIIQQNLLFLLPFYIFRYKSGLQSQVESRVIKTETQALAALKKIKKELDKLNQAGIINIYERSMLEELTVRVAKAMAKNSECIMKEVDDIMGGQVLDYEAKDILNKGREEGRAEGIRTVVHLCKKHGGFMQDAIDEIVDMMNLSQDEAENMVKKYW